MSKKIYKYLIGIVVCLLLSTVAEALLFNFKAIVNKNEPVQQITFSESQDDDETSLKLNIDNQYINKLIIEYRASKDINYSLEYSSSDLFNGEKTTVLKDIFDDSFSQSVTNLNCQPSNIVITYKKPKSVQLEIKSITLDNAFHFNLVRTISVFLSLVLIFSLICFYRDGFKTSKIHIYFAIICSLLGTIIIVSQPSATFYSFDDQIHFQDTVNLFNLGHTNYSVGEYHTMDSNVPNSAGHNSINSIEEQQAQNELFNSGESSYSRDVRFAPTYNKIGYLPMSIGYNLAKLLHLPFSICFKIGKIFNLLFYAIMMAYAIKTIKIGKRLLSVIALIPTNIFLASQYSYDPAVVIGISVFISHLVNLYLDKNSRFDFKTAIIMLAAISYACLVKAIYVPFLLLALLVSPKRFTSQKQSRLVKCGIIGISFLLSATFILPTISGTMESDTRGGNTSVSGQLSTVLSNPLDYATLLGNTAIAQLSSKTLENFNNYAYITNQATMSSSNLLYILPILLLFSFLTDNNNNTLTKKQRLSILIANLATIIFIWTALYLTFTPVGNNTINGVQSRYFLPLFFPLLLCLQPKSIHNAIKPKYYNAIIITIPAIINLIMIITSVLSIYAY